jgi:hypothetical protein
MRLTFRWLFRHFAAGVARGFGMAVGFSLLGAVFVWVFYLYIWPLLRMLREPGRP